LTKQSGSKRIKKGKFQAVLNLDEFGTLALLDNFIGPSLGKFLPNSTVGCLLQEMPANHLCGNQKQENMSKLIEIISTAVMLHPARR